MTKSTRHLIVFLAAALMLTTSAQAATLAVLGGANWYHGSDQNIPAGGVNNGTGSQAGYEFGLGLNFHLIPMLVTFEVDGLYDHNSQAFGSGSLKSNNIQVPALFHLWLGRALSVGAGGFYSFTTGNITETDANGNQLYAGNPGGLNLASSNYGALGDVRIRFPMGMGHFFLDGRYLLGLKTLNTSGSDTLQSREAQAMLGYAFVFGGGGYR